MSCCQHRSSLASRGLLLSPERYLSGEVISHQNAKPASMQRGTEAWFDGLTVLCVFFVTSVSHRTSTTFIPPQNAKTSLIVLQAFTAGHCMLCKIAKDNNASVMS